jgi:hypothetical protein
MRATAWLSNRFRGLFITAIGYLLFLSFFALNWGKQTLRDILCFKIVGTKPLFKSYF